MSVLTASVRGMDLTDTDRAILDLESSWFKYEGAKTTTMRVELGMTPVRYYQCLNSLLDRPESLAYAPMTVRRLQRVREARRSVRSEAHRLRR